MICPTCGTDTQAPRPRWVLLALLAGFVLGHLIAPSIAHAAESYGSQLERIARAAESIARTLDKAAR